MDSVGYFAFVRDIPFRLPLSADEPAPYCVDKHVVLKALLSSLGFKVRYATCRWLWSSLDLPESVKGIPHGDLAAHVYLEVYNKEKARWMTVDATWDKGLASKLPVSEWDGRSDTVIGVKPIERLPPIETEEEFEKLRARIQQGIKVSGRFFGALNKWLESIRT
jgi:arylamine N-acetyltransferase